MWNLVIIIIIILIYSVKIKKGYDPNSDGSSLASVVAKRLGFKISDLGSNSQSSILKVKFLKMHCIKIEIKKNHE